MHRRAFLFLILVSSAPAWSAPRLELSLGYFGEMLSHPGGAAALDYAVVRSDTHSLLVGLQGGGYLHPGSHGGGFLRARIGYRATASFGLEGGLLVGVGWLQTVLAGTTYLAQPDGTVAPV